MKDPRTDRVSEKEGGGGAERDSITVNSVCVCNREKGERKIMSK